MFGVQIWQPDFRGPWSGCWIGWWTPADRSRTDNSWRRNFVSRCVAPRQMWMSWRQDVTMSSNSWSRRCRRESFSRSSSTKPMVCNSAIPHLYNTFSIAVLQLLANFTWNISQRSTSCGQICSVWTAALSDFLYYKHPEHILTNFRSGSSMLYSRQIRERKLNIWC